MKRLAILFLAAVLTALCAGCALAEEPAAASTLEGCGYDSPEDAVMAYIDAMNRGDVGGMISTFAVESFAEHADPYLYLVHMMSVSTANLRYAVPTEDPFYRSLTEQVCCGEIASRLLCTLAAEGDGIEPGTRKSAEEWEELTDRLRQSPLYSFRGNVEFVRWISPVNLTEGSIARPTSANSMIMSQLYTGADDIAELVAEVRISGKRALQGMTCIRYGDRWYNLDPTGRAIMLCKVNQQGVKAPWILTEEEQAEVDRLLAEDYTEENNAWDALRTSDMAGERWPLVSLSTPGFTVYGTREEAENDNAGVWAEVNFHRTGGAVITLAGGTALQEALEINTPSSRVCFDWSPDGIEVYHTNKKGVAVQTFRPFDAGILSKKSVSAVLLEGDQLMIVLDDETAAVFRKPEEKQESAVSAPAGDAAGDRLEGNGFDTPQEAVLAYLDAMNRADARGMLSTMAMETYTAHTDPLVTARQSSYFDPGRYTMIPYLDSDPVRSLAAWIRYGDIAQYLLTSCVSISTDVRGPIRMNSPDEVSEYLERLLLSPVYGLEGKVEFVQWINPACLTEGHIVEYANTSSLASSAAAYNPDDYTFLAALVRINGTEMCQVMRCACYGGRWYNLEPGGPLAYMLSKPTAEASLWMLTEEEKAGLAERLVGYPEEDALWEKLQESEPGGTCWTLEELTTADGNRAAVPDDAAEAEADTGLGAQGTIRFFRMGGAIITLSISPSLQEKMGLRESPQRIAFGWVPDGNGIAADYFREVLPGGTGFLEMTCTMSGDGKTVTVEMYDGMRAVFRKE